MLSDIMVSVILATGIRQYLLSSLNDKSEFEEIVKMKDGKHPNPNIIHPIAGYDVVG